MGGGERKFGQDVEWREKEGSGMRVDCLNLVDVIDNNGRNGQHFTGRGDNNTENCHCKHHVIPGKRQHRLRDLYGDKAW